MTMRDTSKYSNDALNALLFGNKQNRSGDLQALEKRADSATTFESLKVGNILTLSSNSTPITTKSSPSFSISNETDILNNLDQGLKILEGKHSPVFLNRIGAYLKDKIVPSLEAIKKAETESARSMALTHFYNYLNEFLKHTSNVETVVLFVGKLGNLVSKFLNNPKSVDLAKVIAICSRYLSNLAADAQKLINELNSQLPSSIPDVDMNLFFEEDEEIYS